ncbi:MAG: F0F1 ATP synthase subunit B [Candidatus Buchananbacteria bacterium]|nr:F0F1 ATP synthase subunit B [Candidatus Buchananbacteria bacterium]
MDSIISTFHLDWRLMLAQAINFAIVAYVLWRFAIKPLSQMMADRTQQIEKGLADAQLMTDRLQETEATVLTTISEARREAQEIIITAETQAEKKYREAVEKTKGDVMTIIQEGKLQLARDREVMLREVRTEVGELVVTATTAILKEVVDKKIDRKLIEKVITDIS